MPFHDEPISEPMEPDPDPRVVAMQRLVDAEQRAYAAARDAKRAAERADMAQSVLQEARMELNKMLGVAPGVPTSEGMAVAR